MKKTTTYFVFAASVFLFTMLQIPVSAQFYDSFSDGNYTSNPVWSGDTSRFKVNVQHQLQTKDTVAGKAYLSTPANLSSLANIQWNFYIHLGFPPSANNNARVYLTSDSANLENGLHGYFLQFGEALSLDAVELFRQDDTVLTSVCRGNNSEIATAFYLGVKVTRDSTGFWQLLVDTAGGTNYILEASATDVTYNTSSWFGVVCKYTTSNAVSFYYDNFNVSSSFCNLGVSSVNTNVSCFGDSTGTASIQAIGGLAPYSYSWSPDGQITDFVSGLPAGNYTGTVIDINQCISVAEITILQPLELINTISATPVTCNGDSNGTATAIVQGGTAPYTYLWSPGGENSAAIAALSAGVYTLTITDSLGCSQISDAVITEPLPLIINSTVSPASCAGCCDGVAGINPTGGTSPYTYLWSNGATTPFINSLCADTFIVTVTDALGCFAIDTIIVTFNVAVNELLNENNFQITPNPAKEFVLISSGFILNTIEIYSMVGEKIIAFSAQTISNKPQTEMLVDIGKFNPGIYFVRVQTENGIIARKFVKQ
jgi:hypothetical protein